MTFLSLPSWTKRLLLNRTIYQRLNSSWPRFVPNNMNEVGVFLHHIVHRYDELADITLFSQGDISEKEAQSCPRIASNQGLTGRPCQIHTISCQGTASGGMIVRILLRNTKQLFNNVSSTSSPLLGLHIPRILSFVRTFTSRTSSLCRE